MSRPGRYNRVSPRLWRESWSDDARTVALYLLTCEHRTTEGLYRLPLAYAATDLRWSPQRFRQAFAELVEDGFAEYDDDAQVVFIVKALEYQKPENPNQLTAAVNALVDLPKTPLLARLSDASAKHCPTLAERLRQAFPEGFAQPHNSNSNSKTEILTDLVAVNGDHSQNAVELVWEAYDETRRSVFGERSQAKLTPDRRRLIDRRLRDFSLDDLVDACRGWRHSKFHLGDNDRHQRYCDLKLVLRDAGQIEKFRDLERGGGGPVTEASVQRDVAARLFPGQPEAVFAVRGAMSQGAKTDEEIREWVARWQPEVARP